MTYPSSQRTPHELLHYLQNVRIHCWLRAARTPRGPADYQIWSTLKSITERESILCQVEVVWHFCGPPSSSSSSSSSSWPLFLSSASVSFVAKPHWVFFFFFQKAVSFFSLPQTCHETSDFSQEVSELDCCGNLDTRALLATFIKISYRYFKV